MIIGSVITLLTWSCSCRHIAVTCIWVWFMVFAGAMPQHGHELTTPFQLWYNECSILSPAACVALQPCTLTTVVMSMLRAASKKYFFGDRTMPMGLLREHADMVDKFVWGDMAVSFGKYLFQDKTDTEWCLMWTVSPFHLPDDPYEWKEMSQENMDRLRNLQTVMPFTIIGRSPWYTMRSFDLPGLFLFTHPDNLNNNIWAKKETKKDVNIFFDLKAIRFELHNIVVRKVQITYVCPDAWLHIASSPKHDSHMQSYTIADMRWLSVTVCPCVP